MQQPWQRPTQVCVVDNEKDVPTIVSGVFVPPRYAARRPGRTAASASALPEFRPERIARREKRVYQARIVLVSTLCLLLVFAGGFGTAITLSGTTTVAAPIVSLQASGVQDILIEPGANELFTQAPFYEEAKAQFIAQGLTFIEANLSTMELVYREAGHETMRVPIASKGKEGSWWETPAGLYEVAAKKENHVSSFGNVNLPYSMPFQGNFFIHGWPEYPDGTPVPEGYSGGCIRLATEDAARLFAAVPVGTPILVFEESFVGDEFVYEATLPEMDAAEYLLADVENNTVLAASDLTSTHPIASITKLMTALIAAEHINLDTRVPLVQEKYVQTLIPRIQGSANASMYSLLQLLLVESSNEAAEVIASQLGRDRFINEMNAKAKAIGLTDTTFTDPSGLDNGNISTVGDLFTLVQYLHHNRRFILDLTANQDLPTAYEGGDFGELTNFNVASTVPSFIGGKVGETLAAGQTSVSLHRFVVDGTERTIAAVVLGSPQRKQDVERLLQYLRDRYGAAEVLYGDIGR